MEYPFLKDLLDFRLPPLARRTCTNKYLSCLLCARHSSRFCHLVGAPLGVDLEEHRAFEYALPGLGELLFPEPLGFSPDS